jgi:TRAP-type mannitol/chloroaromatic compound transport system permease large subunit
MAGILPGIMLAVIFMLYVVIWSILNKNQMPKISENFLFRKN